MVRTWDEIRRERVPVFDMTAGMSRKFESYATEVGAKFDRITDLLSQAVALLVQIEENTRPVSVRVMNAPGRWTTITPNNAEEIR